MVAGCARFSRFSISTSVPALLWSTTAWSADPTTQFDDARFNSEPQARNWTPIIGAGATYEPEYEGGDKFEVSPIPVVVSPKASGLRSIRPVLRSRHSSMKASRWLPKLATRLVGTRMTPITWMA